MAKAKYFGALFQDGSIERLIRKAIAKTEPYGIDVLKSYTPVDTGHLRDGVLNNATRNPQRYNPKAVKRNTRPQARVGEGWISRKSSDGFRVFFENSADYALFVDLGTRRMAPRNMRKKAAPEIREEFIYQLESGITRLAKG